MDRAILFLNLGGPESLKDVKSFLYRLFSDPEIIRIKFSPLRKLVAWALSTLREKTSQALYQKIGGGSPIKRLTDDQAAKVEKALNKEGYPSLVRSAFTCSDPLVEKVIKNLYAQGVRRFLSFPLFPQYSFTTTKSGLDQVQQAVRKYAPESKITELVSWPTHPLFLDSHIQLITEEINKFQKVSPDEIYLLFSAHSIPEKLVTQEGDPYRDQMACSNKSGCIYGQSDYH